MNACTETYSTLKQQRCILFPAPVGSALWALLPSAVTSADICRPFNLVHTHECEGEQLHIERFLAPSTFCYESLAALVWEESGLLCKPPLVTLVSVYLQDCTECLHGRRLPSPSLRATFRHSANGDGASGAPPSRGWPLTCGRGIFISRSSFTERG